MKWVETQCWTSPGFPGKWIKPLNIIIVMNSALGMKEALLSCGASALPNQNVARMDERSEWVQTDQAGEHESFQMAGNSVNTNE